jgi:hypothetical protein
MNKISFLKGFITIKFKKMKRKVLKLVSLCLFLGILLLSFSSNSSSKISIIERAVATKVDQNLMSYAVTCSDGRTIIFACGQGFQNCTPNGVCP